MTSINISNLTPPGVELFHDSETFLHELTDVEISAFEVYGGWADMVTIVSKMTATQGYTIMTNSRVFTHKTRGSVVITCVTKVRGRHETHATIFPGW